MKIVHDRIAFLAVGFAKRRAKNQVDSKAQAVLEWLSANLKTNGQWNDRRVIPSQVCTVSWPNSIIVSPLTNV